MTHAREFKAESSHHLRILAVAERLFAEVGFDKTTVADIAGELRMSSANIYRFFPTKAAINEAVASRVLCAVEHNADAIAAGAAPARDKLRAFIATLEKANADRFTSNARLHGLIETAFNENWKVARDHVEMITGSLAKIIAEGDRLGELQASDCGLAAILMRSACIRFYHPRVMVEAAQEPEPTVDQMVDFCLAALTRGESAAIPAKHNSATARPIGVARAS